MGVRRGRRHFERGEQLYVEREGQPRVEQSIRRRVHGVLVRTEVRQAPLDESVKLREGFRPTLGIFTVVPESVGVPVVVAGVDSVTIKSGGDTTLKGATVTGKQVTATVGGNLNIESLQDTATYAEKNQQIGASGMVGAGMSGSVNYAKSDINSTYASVTEQSGIKAGDGGFTVNVQGNTDLKGGAITSTQAAIDNNKNAFSTGGTLTTSDIENKASYEAKSVSVSAGAGGSPMPGQGLSAALWHSPKSVDIFHHAVRLARQSGAHFLLKFSVAPPIP